jgi:hypothetical protein
MSNKVLKEMIGNLDQAELEKLSLAETLSVEEAVCDSASAPFLVETATFLGEATADMPMNPADVAAALRNNDDFDKYQRFNQNNISGIDDEDLQDMTDPDQRGSVNNVGNGDLNEGMSAVAYGSEQYAYLTDPDRGLSGSDIPDESDLEDQKKRIDTDVKGDGQQMVGVPGKTSNVLGETVAFLLGESQDNMDSGSNDLTGDDGEDGDEDDDSEFSDDDGDVSAEDNADMQSLLDSFDAEAEKEGFGG